MVLHRKDQNVYLSLKHELQADDKTCVCKKFSSTYIIFRINHDAPYTYLCYFQIKLHEFHFLHFKTLNFVRQLIRLYLFKFTDEKIVVFLNMSAQNLPPVASRNTIAEIKGRQYPDQVGFTTSAKVPPPPPKKKKKKKIQAKDSLSVHLSIPL